VYEYSVTLILFSCSGTRPKLTDGSYGGNSCLSPPYKLLVLLLSITLSTITTIIIPNVCGRIAGRSDIKCFVPESRETNTPQTTFSRKYCTILFTYSTLLTDRPPPANHFLSTSCISVTLTSSESFRLVDYQYALLLTV